VIKNALSVRKIWNSVLFVEEKIEIKLIIVNAKKIMMRVGLINRVETVCIVSKVLMLMKAKIVWKFLI
jgi:hypothetical protein